jgi:hypothetical protein
MCWNLEDTVHSCCSSSCRQLAPCHVSRARSGGTAPRQLSGINGAEPPHINKLFFKRVSSFISRTALCAGTWKTQCTAELLEASSSSCTLRAACCSKGGLGPIPFHAFRRACAFYSWYRLRPTWWAPAKSKDIVARARSFRVRPFWPERRRMSRASTKCTEVLAGRHKSDCRSTAGEDQQGLRLCGLEGRRSMQ